MQAKVLGDILGLGTPELIIILIILLLLFGSTQLPKLARSIGKSSRELKSGLKGEDGGKKSDDTANK
jgi:sec-independent protein translocase protein TatA